MTIYGSGESEASLGRALEELGADVRVGTKVRLRAEEMEDIQFVIGKPEVSTALVGLSNREQLEQAAASAERGPLPAEAVKRLHQIWSNL